MKLVVIAVGTRMPSWVNDGHAEYAKRMPRSSGLELVEIKPESRTSGKPPAQLLAAEAERIRAALPKNSRIVALDEKGKDLTTVALAGQMADWMQEGGTTSFIVGSADGLDAGLKKSACMQWRLSSLTLPHGLVRVLLAEQLYRAVSLLNHHPYHRE